MKILIISYFFPPYNQVGAVRIGKYAKYLNRMEHDVRVLACKDLPLPEALQIEIDSTKIVRTRWFDVNWPITALLGKKRVESKGFEISGSGDRWVKAAKKLYQTLLHFPDAQIGWYPYAKKEGGAICKQWKPDLIYASALPVTSLFIASSLSRKYQIPWIAEFRDLWADNHNRAMPAWRHFLEARMERRLLRSVSGMVTVSEPLAETLRSKYEGKPVLMLPNGFDPEDYDKPLVRIDDVFSKSGLNILYTGMLYPGRYDLDTFFSALAMVPVDEKINVHFFGRYINLAAQEAELACVSSLVHCHDPVAYERSVSLQKSTDILLMFLWNDPEQKGVYTGKLFEYLAARRPILAIGTKDSAPAQLILDRNAGLVSDNPVEIREWLENQLVLKLEQGKIPQREKNVASGFSRGEQVIRLDAFMNSCLQE